LRVRGVLLLMLSSCSFTVATGFNECTVDTDCAMKAACVQSYCIAMPDGCQRGEGTFDKADRIAFTAVLPLTVDTVGTPDDSEKAGLNAFNLAIDEMNQRMGANGHSFGLYLCDSQRDDDKAKTQATFFSKTVGVPAIVTSGSQQTIAVSEATRADGTMVMSATSTAPDLVAEFVASGGLLWRTAPPDTLQARVLAQVLTTDGGYDYDAGSKLGIVYVDDAYGQGLSAELLAHIPAATAVPVNDPAMAIATLKAAGATGITVLIAVAANAKPFLQAAFNEPSLRRDAGHAWAFADAAKDPDILTVPGATYELAGSLGTAPAQGAGAPYPIFRQAYIAKFSADPNNFSFTSHSYDAMYLLGLGASYATGMGHTLNGHTMATAMGLVSAAATPINLQPTDYVQMSNDLATGAAINVEGNSGHLDYIPDAGAPISPMEIWSVEADGGFKTRNVVDPPMD
jgi:branched-chain amino acid transport system substrate-binding protein